MAYYARPDEGVTITEEPDVIRVSSRGATHVEYPYHHTISSGFGGVSVIGGANDVVVCAPSQIVDPCEPYSIRHRYVEPAYQEVQTICEPVGQEYVSQSFQRTYAPQTVVEPARTYISLDQTNVPVAEPVRNYVRLEGGAVSATETVVEPKRVYIPLEGGAVPPSSSLPSTAPSTEPAVRKYISLNDQTVQPSEPVTNYTYQQPQVVKVESVPETAEADWVVVEKVPRTTVRHAYTGETGVGTTSDGRYIIGEPDFGQPKGAAFLSDHSDGILKLPDGRIKYADGGIQAASPAKTLLQGSIVQLSDGSVLLPDGTIEYPDGTVRKPTNSTYSAGIEYTEKAWAELQKNNSSNIQGLTQQITDLKEQLSKEVETLKAEKTVETAELKQKLEQLQSEKYIYEKELTILKETGPGNWAAALEALRSELRILQAAASNPDHRDALLAKEEHLRTLHEQFLAEARANAEARALLQALQEERTREAESRRVAVSEAVLRKEQELAREKEHAVAEALQRSEREREAILAQELAQAQAQAEQLLEQELSAERSRLNGELQQLQEFAEAQRQRAEEEHLLAAAERERALVAEEQLAALQAAIPEKKKKKKKGKKKAKGKAKPKAGAIGVIGGVRRPVGVVTSIRQPARLVSKKPAAKRA